MDLKRILLLAVVALASGCVSATQHFGARAQRMEAWGDQTLARNPRYASRVAAEYTQFLLGLPAHPSLDGIRARVLSKRAAAYRLMKRDDLARKDQAAVQAIESKSPYFREGGTAARPAVEPAPEFPGGPEAEPLEPGPVAAPMPSKPGARISIDVGAGIVQLTQRDLRSDSRSHPDRTVELADDFDLGTTTGIPELSLRMRGARSSVSFGLDHWMGRFNGETEIDSPLHYDGQTYVAGENVRTRLVESSTYAYLRIVPSTAMLGKVDLDLGVKHVYLDLRTSGSLSGTHVDSMHVVMLYPGLHLSHNVGNKFFIGGTIRGGGMIWAASSYSILALGLEARLEARVVITPRFELLGGIHVEHLSFLEEKSDNRRKEASIGIAGGFAEACFRF